MREIFESGHFASYKTARLDSARSNVQKQYGLKTTVFISHKHDDLEDLKGLLGYLELKYGVKVYIDSRDPSMPDKTSGQTATNIKSRICQCDKFILLATNGAVESKWCNWELGYGDAQKFNKGSIAIFPVKPQGASDFSYKGREYMEIYPHIAYYSGYERYKSGQFISEGYYVVVKENPEGTRTIISLDDWFKG